MPLLRNCDYQSRNSRAIPGSLQYLHQLQCKYPSPTGYPTMKCPPPGHPKVMGFEGAIWNAGDPEASKGTRLPSQSRHRPGKLAWKRPGNRAAGAAIPVTSDSNHSLASMVCRKNKGRISNRADRRLFFIRPFPAKPAREPKVFSRSSFVAATCAGPMEDPRGANSSPSGEWAPRSQDPWTARSGRPVLTASRPAASLQCRPPLRLPWPGHCCPAADRPARHAPASATEASAATPGPDR